MRRSGFFLILLAMLFTVRFALAADAPPNWLIVKSKDGAYGYDSASIDTDPKSGQKLVTLGLYLPQGQQWDKIHYYYMFEDIAFDCAKQKYLQVLIYLFDQSGEPLDVKEAGGAWAPINENGVNGIIHQVVCLGRTIPQAVPAGDHDAAMKAMKALFQ